jgi:hypothetical protein
MKFLSTSLIAALFAGSAFAALASSNTNVQTYNLTNSAIQAVPMMLVSVVDSNGNNVKEGAYWNFGTPVQPNSTSDYIKTTSSTPFDANFVSKPIKQGQMYCIYSISVLLNGGHTVNLAQANYGCQSNPPSPAQPLPAHPYNG